MNARPNILLVTTDQQSATMMSCAGNRDLRTPAMDALAADGVRFEKAYVSQPLCIPQRCSWYTGLMPHQHGVTFNIDTSVLTAGAMMGQIFRGAGYATGYSGKWHINVPVADKDRHGFGWVNNIRNNGADKGIVPDFKKFLDDRDGRPFLFSASFNNPHNICEATHGGPFPDGDPGIPAADEVLPALPDNFGIPAREPSIIREVQEMYRTRNYPTADWDEARWRLHRWQYCRITEIVDRYIGELLQVLRDSHDWNDTVVVFTSDHGDGNGHHGWNQKQLLYDESARVPFVISMPGSGMGRVDERQLVNTGIDLIPTLCGLADIGCPDGLAGKAWSAVRSGSDIPPGRDHLVIETELGTYGKSAGYIGRAVRSPRYKYMVFSAGQNHEFLVDMEADPGETVNLAGDAMFKSELERHRAWLRDYIIQTEDGFPLEWVGEVS